METIIALDFSSKEEVLNFLKKFDEPVYVKVGMELVYSCGFELIKEIKQLNHKIFLDLKLHDIPNTVHHAMKNLALLDVDIVNLHASGGVKMMQEAIKGLEAGSIGQKRPKCIAVTQLTSTSKAVMNEELLIPGEVIDVVEKYARNAKLSGLDGIVCSPHESLKIHELLGDEFLTVCPGIRFSDGSNDDQVRVATPEYALENKCSMIVVGRAITKADDPKAIYDKINNLNKEQK